MNPVPELEVAVVELHDTVTERKVEHMHMSWCYNLFTIIISLKQNQPDAIARLRLPALHGRTKLRPLASGCNRS